MSEWEKKSNDISSSVNQYRHSMKVTLSGYCHLYKRIVTLCRMVSSILGSCLGGSWFRKKKNCRYFMNRPKCLPGHRQRL